MTLQVAAGLQPEVHYAIDPKDRLVALTAAGRKALAGAAPAGDACWSATRRREELVRQALAAQHLFRRDEHYIVRDGKVHIVDASTGRLMPDRSWELGLHQMIEAWENCEITPVTESIARITYQRFFRRYGRLAAATGTAREVAGELWSVYRLRVFTVPTHRPCRRVALPSRIHLTREDKEPDVVARVREFHAMQRPVLIGTASACRYTVNVTSPRTAKGAVAAI